MSTWMWNRAARYDWRPLEIISESARETTSFTSRGFGAAKTSETSSTRPPARGLSAASRPGRSPGRGKLHPLVQEFLHALLDVLQVTRPLAASIETSIGTGKLGPRWTRRSLDEPKAPALRENRRLVLKRSVPEMENEAVRYAVSPREFDRIAVRDHGAIGRAKNEEPAHDALRVADAHQISAQNAPPPKQARTKSATRFCMRAYESNSYPGCRNANRAFPGCVFSPPGVECRYEFKIQMRYSRLLPLSGALILALLFAAGCASTGPSAGPGPAGAPAPSEHATLGFEENRSRGSSARSWAPGKRRGRRRGKHSSRRPGRARGRPPERRRGEDRRRGHSRRVRFPRRRVQPPGWPGRRRRPAGGSKLTLTLAAARQDALFEKSCRAGVLAACFRQAWSLPAAGTRATAGVRSGSTTRPAARVPRTRARIAACSSAGRKPREHRRPRARLRSRERRRCATLAFLHATGKFVPKDDRRANALYVKSCALGDEQGCYNEGLMADEGRGTGRDLARAVARYREGCEAGSAPRARTSASSTNTGPASARTRRGRPRSTSGDATAPAASPPTGTAA